MKLVRLIVCLVLVGGLLHPSRTLAAAPPPTAAKSGTTAQPVPERALTKMVYQGKGVLTTTIRSAVYDSTEILSVNWPYVAGGRHTTTMYSMGPCQPTLPPDRFMRLMKWKPDGLLMLEDTDEKAPSVDMGTVYHMLKLGPELTLVVTEVTPGYFTLVDQSHRHEGSVTYGAFKDGAGELWVYEECVGDFFTTELGFVGLHNRHMVEPAHRMLEAMVRLYVEDGDAAEASKEGASTNEAPCPAKFKTVQVVGVNGLINTGIEVKRGDKITLSASGLVSFGFFAGQGGPEGIQFGTDYNYFSDLNHGCLIARIRQSLEENKDTWSYVGKGLTVTADHPGTLELNVNDNDPGNNTGEFRVEISVCRAH